MLAGDVLPPGLVPPPAFDLDGLAAAVRVRRLLGQPLGREGQVVEAEHDLGLRRGHLLEHAPLPEELVRHVPLAAPYLRVVDARLEAVGLLGPLLVVLRRRLFPVQLFGDGVDLRPDRLRVCAAGALRHHQPRALVVELAERPDLHAPSACHLAHELRALLQQLETHAAPVLLDEAPHLVDERARFAVCLPGPVAHRELRELLVSEGHALGIAQEHHPGQVRELLPGQLLGDRIPVLVEPLDAV